MRASHILLLCILGYAMLSSVICQNGTGPDDCCFSFYPRRLNKNLISSYDMTDFRCTKSGIILISKKGRRICVDPNVSWVQGIMRSVDERTL
ncbi:C-C motif chemokine 36.1 [Epinephelus lanceolatus]|uniref:C-C motif chemokine 18 n=1 Tax=Epinephelus lanceolatus TaxID=310571 RepID=UPI0014484AB2|nr:C-C motif chemokine 18 [Epinephelus lanceolatus]